MKHSSLVLVKNKQETRNAQMGTLDLPRLCEYTYSAYQSKLDIKWCPADSEQSAVEDGKGGLRICMLQLCPMVNHKHQFVSTYHFCPALYTG